MQLKYSNLDLSSELKEHIEVLLSINEISLTIKEIISTWLKLRKYIASNRGRRGLSGKDHQLSQKDLGYLTKLKDEFISKIKKSKIDINKSDFSHSIRFLNKFGDSFLFPWDIFVEIRHNNDTLFLDLLVDLVLRYPRFRNFQEFINLFNKTRTNHIVARSKLSIQYLNVLINQDFNGSKKSEEIIEKFEELFLMAFP